jgi:hypothetical protein
MRYTLQSALDKLHQEAQAAGRPDLVDHVQGIRYIVEGICKELDAAREAGPAKDRKVDLEDV